MAIQNNSKFFLLLTGLFILMAQSLVTAQTLEFRTEKGSFEVTLNAKRAPLTVANFLRYVDAGLMKNTSFYRTVTVNPDNQLQSPVKIEVIQGGWKRFNDPRPYPDIVLETTQHTGLKHLDGTISMARDKPNSASTEYFICIGSQPELDFKGRRNPDGQGFAAFGRVSRGMDVVRAIHKSSNSDQTLRPRIRIKNVQRKQKGWFTEARAKPYSPTERVLGVYQALQMSAGFWLDPKTESKDYIGYLTEQLSPFIAKSDQSQSGNKFLPDNVLKILSFLTPDLKRFVDQIMRELAGSQVDRVTESIKGDRATVVLSIRGRNFLNGETRLSTETFRLTRIDGVWYLDAGDLASKASSDG